MPSHFKFKEYCPMVFRNLRERFGIDDQDFQVSCFCNLCFKWVLFCKTGLTFFFITSNYIIVIFILYKNVSVFFSKVKDSFV